MCCQILFDAQQESHCFAMSSAETTANAPLCVTTLDIYMLKVSTLQLATG